MSPLPFDDEPDAAATPAPRGRRGRTPATPASPRPAASTQTPRSSPDRTPSAAVTAPAPATRVPATPPAVTRRRVLSVAALTAELRVRLEAGYPDVWVDGEISNGRVWSSGHYYFQLKDATAQIRGVMFRTHASRLRFEPQDGMQVLVRGSLSVYEAKGEYQLVAQHMEPRGAGALQLAFEQLKQRLQDEGLFAQARKRPLPALPRRIGMVTSLDGAAIRDMLTVLLRRHPNAQVLIAHTRVQGDGAAADIAQALARLTRIDDVDVVIVGRGGGSIEDLWAFNEEVVARAIAASPVPVISAVGHETDVTIADFVADLRAPTPSAAAELVLQKSDDFAAQIRRWRDRLSTVMAARLARDTYRVHRATGHPALAGLPLRVSFRARRLDDLAATASHAVRAAVSIRLRRLSQATRLLTHHDPRHRLARGQTALAELDGRLRAAIAARQQRTRRIIERSAAHLHALSPLGVLGRGYAVCWDGTRRRVIRAADEVQPGDAVRITLGSGELVARVTPPDVGGDS